MFFSEDLVRILADEKFLILIKPLYFTALGYIFLVFSTIWNGILYALGKSKQILQSYLITAVTTIILSALLVKKYNIMGVSIAYMIANIVLFATMTLSTRNIRYNFNQKERIVNMILVLVFFGITILQFFSFKQEFNRLFGSSLLIVVSISLITTNYIQPQNIFKLFRK